MKTNGMIRVLLLSGACLASVACGSKKSAPQTEAVEVAKPKVTTTIAHIEQVEMQSTFTGNVEGFAVNNITPQQARRITRLLVDVGDRVAAGQKVAEMDNSSLAQAKAQYENQKAAFERADELYKFGGESKANWEASKTAYEVSKLTYENLLENTTLISPVAGVVTARNYDNGDMVGALPIFVVQKINPVKIALHASESLYSYLKKGMVVEVELDALPERQFKGRISRITPAIDAATRTFEVEVTVANDREEIKPGMYARVTMNYGKRPNIVVPDRAVVKQLGAGTRFIYVYTKQGTIEFRKVELGRRMNDRYEVLSGLNDGEEIVITGQAGVKNGEEAERIN